MIWIYYAYTDILPDGNLDLLIGQLSLQTQSKLSLLKRNEDRRQLLTSLVLLSKALGDNGCADFRLNRMQYGKTGRPFFSDSPFDFNISHTENFAAVAFSKDCRVGIDVEKIKETDISDFTDYFASEQWEDINSATDRWKRFYHYWTLLESGGKADGRGLSLLSTHGIRLKNAGLFIDNVEWYYRHYDFDQSISCCVTTDKPATSHETKKITSL
jgi:4'-phosphopantetheinyl transferase